MKALTGYAKTKRWRLANRVRYLNYSRTYKERRRRAAGVPKREKHVKVCGFCGRVFRACLHKNLKFCSNVCKFKAREKRPFRKCENCGIMFKLRQIKPRWPTSRVCSWNCRGNFYRGNRHWVFKGGRDATKLRQRQRTKGMIDRLADGYILGLLCAHGSSLRRMDILEFSPASVEIKREQIWLRRANKERIKHQYERQHQNHE